MLELMAGELQVWRVDLDCPAADIASMAQSLSADECQRAERFVRQIDRRRFVVGHAACRAILGDYLGVAPQRVEMTIGPSGKPEIGPSGQRPRLCFNLSHSDGLAMVAVTRKREVGVDVQRVHCMEDMGGIVERYFAPGERAAWQSLPEPARLDAFFRCWTRKEAYLKARGVGLSFGLDQFEVSLRADEPARVLWCSDAQEGAARWGMYDISPNQEYLAACVVERGVEKVSIQDWISPR